jgi:hypothetical protein
MALRTLKGNSKIFPIRVNTNPSVKPTILKGKRINQTIGKRKSINKASGQHSTNKRHQKINVIRVFMIRFFNLHIANPPPI